jgi:hypothetical protein
MTCLLRHLNGDCPKVSSVRERFVKRDIHLILKDEFTCPTIESVLEDEVRASQKKKNNKWAICDSCVLNSAKNCPIWYKKKQFRKLHKMSGPSDLWESDKCKNIKDEEDRLVYEKIQKLNERCNNCSERSECTVQSSVRTSSHCQKKPFEPGSIGQIFVQQTLECTS